MNRQTALPRLVHGLLVAGLSLAAAASVAPARAATFEYDFASVFSGQTPSSAAPWGTLSFADQSGGGVLMTLSLDADFAGNVKDFYFNFAASTEAQLDALQFQFVSGVAYTGKASTLNGHKADGDGNHDLLLSYTEGGGFDGGDSSVYLITSPSTLSASMFDVKSVPAPGNGTTWHAALHAQNVDGPGTDSAWIGATPIPEPETYALLLAGLGLLGFVARRRRKVEAPA